MRMRVCVLLAMFVLQGCSVGMAISGKPDPNIGVLSVGQDRGVVLLNLGQPSQSYATAMGRSDVFHLERGNQQSIGRATGHAIMDLLTFGLWEIIGTPIEGIAGDEFTITVEYGKDDKVTKVNTSPVVSSF